MTDDFKSASAEQPVSMHDHPHVHNHGALPLVAAMLGVFLALESIALAYFVTNYVGIQNVQSSILAKKAENDDTKPMFPPLFYVPNLTGDQLPHDLMVVNRQSGRETLAYTSPSDKVLGLVAVPQVGYNGTIYISLAQSTSDAGPALYKLDTNNDNAVSLISVDIQHGAFAVSPDQTKLAYVPFDLAQDKYSTGTELEVYDLISGEVSTIAKTDGTYFWSSISEFDGIGTGYTFHWLDNNCVEATDYKRPQTDVPVTTNILSSVQTYCVHENGE